MLTNIVGFFLGFSIFLHLIIVSLLYRQKIHSLFIPLFIYLNILIIFAEACSIFLLQSFPSEYSLTIFKIRFISQVFIPPVLFHLNQNISFAPRLPRFSFKNIWFFIISIIFSIIAVSGLLIKGTQVKSGMIYPDYNYLYWAFLLYFYAIFYFLLTDIFKRYRLSKRQPEISSLKTTINFILPMAILGFSCLHLLPFWGIVHPVIFLFYPFLSSLTIYAAFKFRLLEYDENFTFPLIFILITSLYLLVFAIILPRQPVTTYLLSVPAILLVFLMSRIFQKTLRAKLKAQSLDNDYNLEEELESFVYHVGQYIDVETLARFISEFVLKILRSTKCAVITSHFDYQPYKIDYFCGFEKKDIEEILSNSNSVLLEKMEVDHKMVNKFDYAPNESIYQTMERYKLYLGIPMITQNKLIGFILIGGDRKISRFSKKDLRLLRIISTYAANTIQNIRAIQNAIQTKKMADLGTMASQIAHDFQSFVALVKLEVAPDSQLLQHAIYMEKLVQDLLNFARPQELKTAPVNINHLIDMTLDMINIPSNIIVERHYSNSIPEINVDSNQIRRVFLNLIKNGIRAMRESGGRLKITTRPLRPLSSMRRNPWIYIEILDEGVGIPEEFLDKIFEPFFTTHKHEGGNGLGLAIVKQIITRHKGFIDVTSKEGKGTIFNIRLPYII